MLKAQLQSDLNAALKQGAVLKRSVLGMVLTAVKNKELAKRGQLSKTITTQSELESQSQLVDAEVLAVLASEVKKRQEASAQFSAAGRAELADKEKQEMAILLSYLPAQLDEAAIRAAVRAAISRTGAKDIKAMGKVISAVMAELKGQAAGGTVSRLVKEELSK